MLCAFVAAVALAVGLDVATGGGPDPLAFTDRIPPGFVLDRAASGELTPGAAAEVTVLAPETLRPRLDAAHLSGGRSRMWTRGDTFAEIEILTFPSPAAARALVGFALDQTVALAGGGADARSAVLGTVPGVPGATSFYAAGNQQVGGQPLFVWGAWFTVGRHAYLVEVGAPQPLDAAFMQTLARAEYDTVT